MSLLNQLNLNLLMTSFQLKRQNMKLSLLKFNFQILSNEKKHLERVEVDKKLLKMGKLSEA